MMKLTLKHLLVVSVILTLFLGLNLVSATNITDDSALSTKNICTHSITSDSNIDVNDINNYVKNTVTSTSANDSNSDENIKEENNGNTGGASNGGTIAELNETINGGSSSSITLDNDYTYNASTDSGFTSGIIVSRDLTIDGQGHTIDLGGKIRFLQSTISGINLVLKNINIKNGNAAYGCAVYIINGSGSFINSTFTDNNATNGGAVNIENGRGSFINSTFTGNNAGYGGVVYITNGSGSFINSTFTGNAAYRGGAVNIDKSNYSFANSTFTGNNAVYGGAVNIEDSIGSFINSTFAGNNAVNGGAVYIINGSGSFINSTFTSNNATYDGGAVYIINGSGSFINTTFTGNNATYDGGAVYIINGSGSFINSTFTGNNATYDGGAVNIYTGSGSFINSTFTGNIAYSGGVIHITDGNGSFINSTFNDNYAKGVYPNSLGGAVNIENSIGSFINSTFTGNNAVNGGAVYIENSIGSFINSTFTGNNAMYGGAVNIYTGSGSFINSTFTNNNATNGGAVFIENGSFINSTFTGNDAVYGGAVYIENGSFINSTFTGNHALYAGGAVYIENGSFINSIFTNNNAGVGGAVFIENGSFINSTFTGNDAVYGGAINLHGVSGSFINSTFTGNNATYDGGAICILQGNGTAILCRFNKDSDTICNVTVIPAILNVLNYTSTYQSGEKLEFNLTADNMVLDGFNTTVDIYKDSALIYTVYGLTGEGWIVDLSPGEYTAVLSLTDHPDVNSSNATISISLGNTTVVIEPIINPKIGKEITINYTTNSNGTATIKVNDEVIPDAKFTPGTLGIYNVVVEVTENEYYKAGSNKTTFAIKLNSEITASPVSTTYNVGKYMVITLKDSNGKHINDAVLTVNLGSVKKYTTNANGQVKINVGTLVPKTYNAKITYAGSNIYESSTGSVKVIVKKAKPKITAKSTHFKFKIKTKKYTAIFKDNKNKALKNTKVTLKVNGKTYSVKTNNKGQGVFKITNLRKIGSYIAVITVPANKYYNKVTKKVKITVK